MAWSMPGFPVLPYLLEFAQAHVHWVGDTIQPSHPLPPSSHFAFSPPQDQGLFQWVGSLHQVAEVLKLQHQSSKWTFRVGLFPLGLTNLISLQFKGLSYIFSSTKIWRHHLFGSQPSYWPSSHIYIWLLEKPELWIYRPLSAKWHFCFLIRCLGLSELPFQGASIFKFHGCSHHPQWFWSPGKKNLSLLPRFSYLFAMKWWDWLLWS